MWFAFAWRNIGPVLFSSLLTEPKARSINLHKKDETNIFPIRTERVSSIRFLLYIRSGLLLSSPRAKLVYVQAVREKVQENKNSNMTV